MTRVVSLLCPVILRLILERTLRPVRTMRTMRMQRTVRLRMARLKGMVRMVTMRVITSPKRGVSAVCSGGCSSMTLQRAPGTTMMMRWHRTLTMTWRA